MNHLIDSELDLSSFDARFKNDVTGAAAYPPAMLLKVILFAYSMGIVSSRNIERACREKVDAQWKLYCLVHNIEKLAHHGYALKVGNPLSSKLDVELTPQ